MVKGTIFSFVVAAVFFVCFVLTMNYIYAILCVFMAMFGVVTLLLDYKAKADKNIESDEEYEDAEDVKDDVEEVEEDTEEDDEEKPIEATASI